MTAIRKAELQVPPRNLPENGRTLVYSNFRPIAAFQACPTVIGFQERPEFSKAYSETIINLRRDIIGELIYQADMASLVREPRGDFVAR